MNLTLIIPVYNAKDDVEKCLKSVLKNFDKQYEFIIVDDCSKEETGTFLKEFAKQHSFVKLYRNEENLGFVKTCNFAMKQATGDIIVLLNSDTEIPTSFCEKIIEAFEKNPNAGVACPIPSYSGHYFLPMLKNTDLEGMNTLIREKHKTVYPKLYVCNGFCFCTRNEVAKKLNYFDEVYGKGYHEETDFCYKILESKLDCILIDNLYVYHKRNASFGAEERKAQLERNNDIFTKKWGGFRENWIEKNNYIDPINLIENEIHKKPLKFFIEKNKDRKIYIFGMQILRYKINGLIYKLEQIARKILRRKK